MSEGNLEPAAQVVEGLRGQVVVLGVDALEHRDQGRLLVLELVDEVVDLVPVFRRYLWAEHLH